MNFYNQELFMTLSTKNTEAYRLARQLAEHLVEMPTAPVRAQSAEQP
jgi:hypothetical protein